LLFFVSCLLKIIEKQPKKQGFFCFLHLRTNEETRKGKTSNEERQSKKRKNRL